MKLYKELAVLTSLCEGNAWKIDARNVNKTQSNDVLLG
jgi:hypothetical protein